MPLGRFPTNAVWCTVQLQWLVQLLHPIRGSEENFLKACTALYYQMAVVVRLQDAKINKCRKPGFLNVFRARNLHWMLPNVQLKD
jgi:hypothetical protein